MVAVHEVPLPPPEKPEREERRKPEFERTTVAVDAASIWVADVHRSAREFARRHDCADVALTLENVGGTRVGVSELIAGPGEGFVTVRLPERELAFRLDRIAGIELVRASPERDAFRVRGGLLGFGDGN